MNSLDLLDDEDGRRIGVPEQLDFLVEGAPASTANRTVVNISPRKAVERKPQARRGGGGVRRVNQSRRVGNNNDDDVANGSMQSQMLQAELLEEVDRLRLELAHSHEEKRELENSFRRLDREIAEGFNLAERKEKELRIAELMTKNQKLAEMLEKEHEKLEELRPANAELKRECERLESRVELLTRALSATEAKRNELESAHMSLTTSYSAAQDRMESLQGQVHEFQEKFVAAAETSGHFAEHEEKLRRWERKCCTLEQKLGEAIERAEAQQQVATIAQNSAMLALSEKEQVETELGNAHDKLIQLTAKLRAVEAKLEADLQHRDASSDAALLRQRIRVLESELSERTRAYLEMKEAMSKMLGSGSRTVGSTRGSKPNTRLTALADKLRSAEDSRDRKGRVVAVLMQAIPFLMCQLDERTDQYQRVVESNAILKSAIEQFQAS